MATATATLVTSGLTGNPSSGYRITGGSATDRVLIQDVVDALSTVLDYDPDTGLVTRAEATPTPYQFAFGGNSATGAKDCFIQLSGIKFQLESNTGVDTASLDLGNDTDKIIFDNQCDLIIGADNNTEDQPVNGNVEINAENFSYNFFNYTPILSRQAKIICHAYLIFATRENSRVNILNLNSDSRLRLIFAVHSLSTYVRENGKMAINLDLDVEEQELIIYNQTIAARDNLTPGGLQGNFLEIPAAVTSLDRFQLFFLSLQNTDPAGIYTVGGIKDLISTAMNTAPKLFVKTTNTQGQNSTIILERYGGTRANTGFIFAARQDHQITEVQQRVKFVFKDPLGSDLTAEMLRVESASTSVSWSGSDNGTPVVTKTNYGEEQDFTDVGEQEVDIALKHFHINKGGNENERDTDDASVVTTDLTPVRYSAWLWGYQIAFEVSMSFPDEQGEQELTAVLSEDPIITAATKADVPDVAATFDDIYDMLAEHAHDNQNGIAATVDGTTLTFADDDVILTTLSSAISPGGGAISVPCAATLDSGTKITTLEATGTITVGSGVTINGVLSDENGTTAIVKLRPSGSSDKTALFSSTGTYLGGADSGDVDVRLTAAQAEDGLKAVSARPGRVPQILEVDAGEGGIFTISFSALRELLLPDGDAMWTSATVDSTLGIEFTDATARIDLGGKLYRAQAILNAFEDALQTEDGLKFLSLGGAQVTINRDPLSGDSIYLNQSDTKLRRDATLGNNNSGVIATAFHPDNEPVDDANGEVSLVSGVQLADFAKAIAVDFDIDPNTVGLQSIAGILLAITDTLGEIGNDDIVERLTNISDKMGDVGTRNLVDIMLALIMGPTELTDESDGTVMKVQDFDGTDYASAKVSDDGERSGSQLL